MTRKMVDINLSEKQIDFMQIETRYGLFEAGIGTGKTFAGALWAAKMAISYPGKRGVIVARDVPQLRNGTLIEFTKVLTKVMGFIEDVDFKHNKAKNEFVFTNGTVVVCVGSLNYDSAFRGPSYSWAWADEADYWSEDAYKALKGRIRVHPEQIRITSSPKGYNFIYDEFYTKMDETKVIVKATTYDNPYLSEGFIEDLRKSYSPKLFRQEVMAERLNLTAGAVYSEFDREVHVKECNSRLTKGKAIHIFTDYNVSHYLAVVTIFEAGKLYIVDEIHLEDANTIKMADTIMARYGKDHHITLSGDSTGNNARNVAASHSNYQIFGQRGITTLPFRNPPVMQRVMGVESAFFNKNVVIDPKCKSLIRDMELMTWKKGLNNEVDKSDITLSHASDCFGYSVWYYLPLKSAQKQSKTRYI